VPIETRAHFSWSSVANCRKHEYRTDDRYCTFSKLRRTPNAADQSNKELTAKPISPITPSIQLNGSGVGCAAPAILGGWKPTPADLCVKAV